MNLQFLTSKLTILQLLSLAVLGLVLADCKKTDPVLSKAQLQVQPTELDFGENETQLGFTIKNVGQQNLNWEISEDVDWITDFQSTSGKINGGGENQITVKIDRTKLNNGANSRKIQVTAKGDDGAQLEGGGIDVTVKATKAVPPQVSMSVNDVTEKTTTTAKAQANIASLGSSNISQYGHVWSTQRDPKIDDGDDAKTTLGEKTVKGDFQSSLASLKANTTYYIRAYATNGQGTSYSSEVSFKTAALAPAVLSMANNDLFNLKSGSATVRANLDKLGSAPITEHGHVWAKTNNPVLGASSSRSRLGSATATGAFTSNIAGLEADVTYHVRAYASTATGTVYSNELSFKTGTNNPPTGLTLSNATLKENQAVGTTIGSFTTADPDADDTHTYSLVSGSGSTGNSGFLIAGANLKSATVFDYEAATSHAIRIRTTDKGGAFRERSFVITISDEADGSGGKILLSNAQIAENKGENLTIGTFSTIGIGSRYSYTFATGGGSEGNSSFLLVNNELRTNKSFNAESQANYSVRIKSTNLTNGSASEQVFNIKILDVNEFTPSNITLTTLSLPENRAIGTLVGTFSTTDGDILDKSHRYTLLSGTSAFRLAGDSLKTLKVFDYEMTKQVSISVSSRDIGARTYTKGFTIRIENVNEAPTALTLSKTSISQGNSMNDTVALLSSSDVDAGDSHTYTLVAGSADFNISDRALRASKVFNYAAKSSYTIRLRTTDKAGASFEKAWTITILPNNPPTNITLSATSIVENNSVNAVIGTLSTADADASDSHTYTLVSGGSDFRIGNDTLYASKKFDYETKNSYPIKIRTSDGKGGTFEKDFTISVTDVPNPEDVVMITVTGGTFEMGCKSGRDDINSLPCYSAEKPLHSVTVSTFKLSKYEITNAQYVAFLNAKGVNSNGSFNDPTYGNVQYIGMDNPDVMITHNGSKFGVRSHSLDLSNYPVIEVTWYGANAYCKWAGGRLPTAAEWEFAARGGTSSRGYQFSSSNTIGDVAWYWDNSNSSGQSNWDGVRTHPVGTKAANELGFHDMSGNVWEWCADWYGTYSSASQTNPTGPSSGSSRVLRGGSWYYGAWGTRVPDRDNDTPSNRIYSYGFLLFLFP